ncbi:MAG TPA: aminotransferase class V-fold PLP-dependent enzyme [Terriglobia bacterium]|nr:aminotransferase class V-fold PLP-dependent enzyme [Terriglobia bacterium]
MTAVLHKPPTEQEFMAAWPAYESTRPLDVLRQTDYARLDRLGHIYLDYTGAGLYASSQVLQHAGLLESHVFGNPHSRNPTSATITDRIEQGRRKVLAYFSASEDEYVAIFTANASQALKLVGEAYPFSSGGHYLLTFDNHNSVNGIREFARARGTSITYVPLSLPEMRVDEDTLDRHLTLAQPGGPNLFAYPAQSNFSGVQHPLEWIARAKAMGWDVLLDAAAFVPIHRLDLSEWHPDFVTISFYKMFGYPTGVGCLLARREALGKLRRPWFAGGTITVASVQGDRYFLAEGASAFEDGTPDYLGIPGVETGLRHLEDVGLEMIHTRCRCLTAWLLQELLSLHHANGKPLVRVYGPLDTGRRGATVAMNLYNPEGRMIDHLRVEEAATERRISLRTGCFCNPGGGEIALRISKPELIGCFSQHPQEDSRFTVDDFRHCVHSEGTGAVRVSLGIVSNFADVSRFVEFIREFLR